MAYNKYKKLKLQYSDGPGSAWKDANPPRYKAGELIEENSPDCGGVSSIYRWYALPDEFVCDGYNKHYKEVYQVSTDEGLTWENVSPLQTRTGQLIESNSTNCGYGITWELVPDEYICEKTTEYIRYQKLQKYYLGQPVDPPEYKKGQLIETGEWETLEQCEGHTEPVIPTGKYLEVVFANNHDDSLITVLVDEVNILNYVDSHTPIGIKLPVLMPDGYYRVMSLYNLSKNNNEGTNKEENLTNSMDGYYSLELVKKFYGIEPLYNSIGGIYYSIRNNFINPLVSIVPTGGMTYGCNISDVNANVNKNNMDALRYYRSTLAYDVFQTTENATTSSDNEAYIKCNKKLRYLARRGWQLNAIIAFFDTEYNLNYQCMKNIDKYPKNEEHYIYYDNYLTNNILSYHEGEKYTDLIIEQFENTNICAKLSREYHTKGTNAGDWFLPSVLELGIAASLVGKIKNTIELLNINYKTSYPFFNYSYYTSNPSISTVYKNGIAGPHYCYISLPPTTDGLDQFNRNNTEAPILFCSGDSDAKVGARAFTIIK